MKMKGLFYLFLIVSIQFCSCMQAGLRREDDCSATRCSTRAGLDYVDIKFPFRFTNQPPSCGYQGFELSCQGTYTMLRLNPASNEEFAVGSITYYRQLLSVYDPDGCLPRKLLHLNLSASPFGIVNHTTDGSDYYYDSVRFYKLVNCSSEVTGTSQSIFIRPASCLSNLPGHYYLLSSESESFLDVLSSSSCEIMTDLNLALTYSIEPTQKNSYGGEEEPLLVLFWEQPNCVDCSGDCWFNRTSNKTECRISPYSNDPFSNDPFSNDPFSQKGSHARNVIIGLCLLAFVVVLSVITVFIYKMLSKTKKKEHNLKIERFLKDYKATKATRYSHSEIKKMTDNFKNKLGQGGYGNVFKGKLHNGVPVAVKVLENPTVSGEEFINEIGTIGRIHHVNIVRLLGFCVEGSTRALIYEFLPNESLEKYILFMEEERTGRMNFSWTKLHDISLGIARGMEYLHQGCDQRILHLDIKPQNILLDQEFNPKISDFGLAKLCSKEKSAVSMTAVRGTMGYIAPEVLLGNNKTVSHKSDVYSFGMLLLEMVGGRKKMEEEDVENSGQIYFPEWIYNQLKQGKELGLETSSVEEVEVAKRLTILAIWCVQWKPVDRPSMKEVVQALEGSIESLPLPANPFASHV